MTVKAVAGFGAAAQQLLMASDLKRMLADQSHNEAHIDQLGATAQELQQQFYVFRHQETFAKTMLLTIADSFRSRDYSSCDYRADTTKVKAHGRDARVDLQLPVFSDLRPADFQVLIGLPGTGKTETIARLLKLFGEQEQAMEAKPWQPIPYVALSCTMEATHRNFCTRLIAEFEKASGLSDLSHVFAHANASEDGMPSRIVELAQTFGVGCLIFDDLQGLLRLSEKERRRIVQLFLSLTAGGLPVVLVGTPPALALMSEFTELQRRCMGSTTFWDRCENNNEWSAFVDTIWPPSALVCNLGERTLSEVLYQRTQGIPGLVEALRRACSRQAELQAEPGGAIDLHELADQVLMLLNGPLKALASEDPLARVLHPEFLSPTADLAAKDLDFRAAKRAQAMQQADEERRTAEAEQDKKDEIVLDDETRKDRALRLEAASSIVMRQILWDAHIPRDKIEAEIQSAWDCCSQTPRRTEALLTYIQKQVRKHQDDVRKARSSTRVNERWGPADLRAILSGNTEPHEALKQHGYAGPKALQF